MTRNQRKANAGLLLIFMSLVVACVLAIERYILPSESVSVATKKGALKRGYSCSEENSMQVYIIENTS